MPYSIHYGLVCKAVTKLVESGTFKSLENLAEEVAVLALGENLHGEWVQIIVEKPRALLRADAAGINIVRRKDGKREVEDKVFVKDLRLVTIVGVNPWERKETQNLVLNLTMHKPRAGPEVAEKEDGKVDNAPLFDPHYDFRKVVNTITEYVEKSEYKTIEALVTSIARVACISCNIDKISVAVEKPSALTFASCAGVEITRQKLFFNGYALTEGDPLLERDGLKPAAHTAFIALGSNVGDRFQMVSEALRMLDKRGLKVLRTSSLYESKPMYVLDQPEFLNGVCQVSEYLFVRVRQI